MKGHTTIALVLRESSMKSITSEEMAAIEKPELGTPQETEKAVSKFAAVVPNKPGKSSGPRTLHGKKQSSRNALKHGIFSKVAVIKGEPREEFDSLLKGLQESLRPEGTLERLLVEKLASLSWRYRRVVIAEGAEIQKAVDFFEWDRDHDRARSVDSGLQLAQFAGGLIMHSNTPEWIARCIELLQELRGAVETRGFDLKRDRNILATVYGSNLESQSRHSLLKSYAGFSVMFDRATEEESQAKQDEQREQAGQEEKVKEFHFSSEEYKDVFLQKLDSQIRWLRRCQTMARKVDADRTELELLTRQIPDAKPMDRLLRYEAALERNFDRTLGQLERLQRMRLGHAVLPPLRVELSS